MPANYMNAEETTKRIGAFRPARSKGTMAAVLLFGLASLFMTGCVAEQKATSPRVESQKVLNAIPMIERIKGSGIKVLAASGENGKFHIAMTEDAYTYLHLYNKTAFSVQKHAAVRRQLDAICQTLARQPISNIQMMPEGTPMDSRLEIVNASFAEAQRQAPPQATPCTCGHNHDKEGHKTPTAANILHGLNLNKH